MAELRDPRARQRDHAHRLIAELEARILPVVQEALDRVAERFARQVLHEREALVAQGGDPIDPLDLTALAALWGVEVPVLVAALRAVYEASELETVRRFGGQALANEITADPDHPLARSLAQRVDDYLETAATRLTLVGDTLVEGAQRALIEGNAAGESVDQIAQRLREEFARGGVELGETRAELIARTEVVGAWNKASIDGARALPEGVRPRYKTWVSTLDRRTRSTHWEVDGETVLIDAQFTVGDVLMDGPHDESAPISELANCRCTLTFGDSAEPLDALGEQRQYKDDEEIQRVVDYYESQGVTRNAGATAAATMLDMSAAGSGPGSRTKGAAMPEPLPPLLAAAADHTSAMIALIPAEEDAARLAVDGGEPADELHITLIYLGQAADIPQAARDAILKETAAIGQQRPPREGDAFAVEVFNPGAANDNDTALVLGLSGEQLAEMHLAAIAAVGAATSEEWSAPEQYQPWAPHITLAYTDDLELVQQLVDRVGPITFDRVRVAFAGETTDIPLEGTPMPDEDVTAAADTRPTRAWSTPGDTALAFEDTQTGDGRIFTPGALYWEGESWPLQYADEMQGGHDGAELAGAIQAMARDGRRITGAGVLYPDTDAGAAVVDLLERDAPLGVSVDLDDVDIELVDSRPADQREAEPLLASSFRGLSMSILATPGVGYRIRAAGLARSLTAAGVDLTAAGITAAAGDHDDPDAEVILADKAGEILLRITRGRVRGATLVTLPAYSEARIVLDEQNPGTIEPITGPAETQVGELMAEIVDYVSAAGHPVRPGEVAEQLGIAGNTARSYLSRAHTAGRLARPSRGQYTAAAAPAPAAVTAAVVGDLDLPIHPDRDREWDGNAAASRVLEWANAQAEGTDDPPSQWLAQAFLHFEDGENPNAVGSYSLGYADVINGELRVVARGVFATAGGRGVDAADLPDDEREAIRARICQLYERLAAEFDDDDLVCPWEGEEAASAETITASAATDPEIATANAELARLLPAPAVIASAWSEFQALPPLPAHWFREPTTEELPPDSGGVHVTDDGRVYGWVAQRGVPHEALGHTIDEVEPIDTSWFLRQKFRLDDGTYTTAGPYVMNVGHHRDGGNCETQACLWDDSRTIAGVVTVGMNDRGMWFSGAAGPWLSDWDQMKLRVCQPSYHMVPKPDGTYRLGAVLAVQRPAHGSRLLAAASVVERSNLVLMPAAAAIHASHTAATPVVLAPESVLALAVATVDEQERRVSARAEAAALRAEMETMQAELVSAQVAALKAEIEGGQ